MGRDLRPFCLLPFSRAALPPSTIERSLPVISPVLMLLTQHPIRNRFAALALLSSLIVGCSASAASTASSVAGIAAAAPQASSQTKHVSYGALAPGWGDALHII